MSFKNLHIRGFDFLKKLFDEDTDKKTILEKQLSELNAEYEARVPFWERSKEQKKRFRYMVVAIPKLEKQLKVIEKNLVKVSEAIAKTSQGLSIVLEELVDRNDNILNAIKINEKTRLTDMNNVKKSIRSSTRDLHKMELLLQESLTKYPKLHLKKRLSTSEKQELIKIKSLEQDIKIARNDIEILNKRLDDIKKKSKYFKNDLLEIKENKRKINQLKKKIVTENKKEKDYQINEEQKEIEKQIKKVTVTQKNEQVGDNYLLEVRVFASITKETYNALDKEYKKLYVPIDNDHYGRWMTLHRFFSSKIKNIYSFLLKEFAIGPNELPLYIEKWDYTSFFDKLRRKLIELGDFSFGNNVKYNKKLFDKFVSTETIDWYYDDKIIRDSEHKGQRLIEDLITALQSTIEFHISASQYVTYKAFIKRIDLISKLKFNDLIMKLLTLHDKTLEDINGEEEIDYEDNLCVARGIIKTLSAYPNNVTPTIYSLHEQFLTLEGEPDIRLGVSTKDVINWVKKYHSQRISVFAFDPLLNCYERYISSHGDASIMLINNNNHCYPITNEEIKSTISRSSKLSFSKPKWEINYNDYIKLDELELELANDMGAFEVSGFIKESMKQQYAEIYQNILKGEYPDKHKVIVIENVDDNLYDVCAEVIKVTNSNIYNININENGKLCSFVHPITNQVFEVSSDYEIRKRMCQTIHDNNKLDNFLFKNQSYADIGRLIYETNFGKLPKSDTFKEDLELIDKFTTSPLIKKNIFDYEKENCFCYDINSSYLTAIMEMEHDYPVFTYFDKNFRIFDESSPILPLGEYIIDNVIVDKYNGFTLPSRILSYEVIKSLIQLGLIERKNIILYRIAKEFLSKDNLKQFVKLVQELFPDKKDYKQIVNHFIGTIGKRYATTTKAFVTNDMSTVFAAFNQYSVNSEWKLSISKVNDLSFVKLKSKRRVLSDTSPIYRQILSRGILQLINLIADRYAFGQSLLIGYKTDCIYIRHPSDEPLDLVKYKIEKWDNRFDPKKTMFYKAEERGHIHILMNTDRRAIIKMVAQRKDLEWNKVENDDNIVNKSCFVSAGPGRGKTLRLCELYEKNVSQVLVPTNKAGNVIRKRGPEKVNTFDSYFSADNRMLSYKINRLMVDEISMVKSKWIRKLYKIRVVRPDLIMQVFGDFNQISPVENIKYDYYNSDVFKQICGNTVTEIEYHEKARYDEEMHEIIEYFKEHKKLHPKLDNRPIDYSLETNIVYTNKTRDRINNKFMRDNGGWIKGWKKGLKIITEEKFKKGNIFKGEMFYVESVSDYGKKIQISVNGDGKLHNDGMKYNIDLFKPAYAVTMHKYQGDTIGKYINGDLIHYNIHDMWHPRVTFNCMLVALSRATTLDQIHLKYTDKIFDSVADGTKYDAEYDKPTVKHILKFESRYHDKSCVIVHSDDMIGEEQMTKYITKEAIKQLGQYDDKEYLKLCSSIINNMYSSLSGDHKSNVILNKRYDYKTHITNDIKYNILGELQKNDNDIEDRDIVILKGVFQDNNKKNHIEKMLTLIKLLSLIVSNRYEWYVSISELKWNSEFIGSISYFNIKTLNTAMNAYVNKYQEMGYVVKSHENKKKEIVVIKNVVNPGKMILKDIKISEYDKFFEMQYTDKDGKKMKKRNKFGSNISKEDAFFAIKEEKYKILEDKYGFSKDEPIFKRSFIE